MRTALFVLALMLQILLPFGQPVTDAVRCIHHPIRTKKSSPKLTPVLVSSWTDQTGDSNTEQVAYLPRHAEHVYAPPNNPSSSKYKNLDLFHTAGRSKAPTFVMHFQRRAKVYLLANVDEKEYNRNPSASATLPGWTSEGWAQLVKGKEIIKYGVFQTLYRRMSKFVYVFSRSTGRSDFVDLPQTLFVKDLTEGISVKGSFNLLIAEADGSASPKVGKFKGKEIAPNTICPNDLHQVWEVFDDNRADTSTRGVPFATWHPTWDPCFWCTYGHDHGSSPEHLMGYTPKLDYTAFKHVLQNEGNTGFKNFVFRVGDYNVFYGLHATTSGLRRTGIRLHTITLAVTDRSTDKLLVELQQKGDFGFLAVRMRNGGFQPVTEKDRKIKAELQAARKAVGFRSVNIIDPKNLNKQFKFRRPVLIGTYEEWKTVPMCAFPLGKKKVGGISLPTGGISAVFRQPSTGVKSRKKLNERINLGRTTLSGKDLKTKTFFKAGGLSRSLRISGVLLSSKYCPGGQNGVFYTDSTGRRILPGPGSGSIRQFFKKDFELKLAGRFEPTDNWLGLHQLNFRGLFFDHGYGIDPSKN